MRIFVNNVDGYLAGAICADLSKLTREIIGTRKGLIDDMVPPSPMLQQVVPRFEVRQLLKTIASCDVVIYDLHDADFEELEMVLRILYSSEIVQDMIFIIISSVGVWARTPREYEEAQEFTVESIPEASLEEAAANEAAAAAAEGGTAGEPQDAADAEAAKGPARPRPRVLKSEDYVRRIPAAKFQEWKTIETLALALKGKGAIRPYVVCAGMPYGNGEDAFLGLFRAAWMSLPTLRVIGHGQNSLPMVHVRDVARLVRHVVEERPELDYHLAVDRGDATQRAIVEAVAKEFGIPYEIRSVSIPEALLAEMADMLTMDLRLEPSPLMKVPPAPEAEPAAEEAGGEAEAANSEGDGAADADEVWEEPKGQPFRWWCERGLPANIATVAREFCRWRRLRPVRLCIAGPPGSAAPLLGAKIAARYNLRHVSFDHLLEETRNADTEVGKTLREKLAEIEAAFANPKSTGPYLLPLSILVKIVEESFSPKSCQYRGFVLSGFPTCLEDATALLMEEQPAPPDAEPAEEDKAAKAKKGGKAVEEAPKTIWVRRDSLILDGVAVVNCTEDVAVARLRGGQQPEEQWMPMFKKKMERWQKESIEGIPGLAEFFQTKLNLTPVVISEPALAPADGGEGGAEQAPAVEDVLDGAVCTLLASVEASVEVNNFMPPPPGPKVAEAGSVEDAPAEDETAKKREEEELRRKRDLEEKLEQIKKDELLKLEKHSEPLRQYLMSFVVPTVTSGLVEVCRAQPEDPVGYLAEYLATYSQMSRKRGRGKTAALSAFPGSAGNPAA